MTSPEPAGRRRQQGGEQMLARTGRERGQATAEYALVIVAAAAIALALILWASSSGALEAFFDAVVAKVTSYV
jgi:Flp pilus assembly pilin Flp